MPRNPFSRAIGVPSEVLARVSLRRGEKVLAGTLSKDGRWLLGTRDALLVVAAASGEPSPAAEPVQTRIPWEEVERADWDRDKELLRVAEVGRFGVVRPEHTFEIDDPGLLLQLVRERVTASVVLQRRVVVSGKQGLFVNARRAPHGDGELIWAYEFDPGVDPEDPWVIEAAEQGLRAAEDELGR